MKLIQLQYEVTCLIDKQELLRAGQKLIPQIERIRALINRGYETEYAMINLPQDKDIIKSVLLLVQAKKKLSISTLVVIGIGGSQLGTMAIAEAIQGKISFCNNKLHVFFADTLDAAYINTLLNHCELELKQGKNILLNVVTKSGMTIETIANFEIFLQLFKQYRPDYNSYIVVTTDKDSPLWSLAIEHNWSLLEIPKKVGGRYSVLSAVGLFPLAFMDITLDALREGARTIIPLCLDTAIEKNPAAISALIKYLHYYRHRTIHDMFLFSVYLESFGKWYRQLMGESLGKEYSVQNKKINVGITPTVSIGSSDLHSVGQLYLAGPDNRFTTFVSIDQNNNLVVPQYPEFNECASRIGGKSVATIMGAILTGTKTAYQQKKRPFCSLLLPENSPFVLGQCLQLYMIEMVYLAHLLDVNPFDQPEVELYKQKTEEILTYE